MGFFWMLDFRVGIKTIPSPRLKFEPKELEIRIFAWILPFMCTFSKYIDIMLSMQNFADISIVWSKFSKILLK